MMASATKSSSLNLGRIVLYALLVLFCLYYLLPLYVMVVNSLKPLSEITAGGMMALPGDWTIAPWSSAWSSAQVGVEATGLRPYFLNSIIMVVPAVALSTLVGALNGYVLTKWTFRGATILFGLLLFGCFIPFQMVLIPMARMLGLMGLAGSVPGLIFVHFVYGIGFSTLYFRNYYAAFPTELVRAAQIDGKAAFDTAKDRAFDALIVGICFFQAIPCFFTAGHLARDDGFAAGIFSGTQVDFYLVADFDFRGFAGVCEFFQLDTAFHLVADVDDGLSRFDCDDFAFDDTALFGGVHFEAFVQEGFEFLHRCVLSHVLYEFLFFGFCWPCGCLRRSLGVSLVSGTAKQRGPERSDPAHLNALRCFPPCRQGAI